MWTILGVVLLAVASAVGWLLARRRVRPGQPRDGYAVRAIVGKGSLVALEISAPARTNLDFELKREDGFDRFGKAIGLAVEAQVGRPGFDDALYLVADVPRVPSALRADRELADELQALFAPASERVARVQRVVCCEGQLVLHVQPKRGTTGQAADALAAELAPPVVAAAQHLAARHPGEPEPDPMFWRATLVLALGIGLFAHGWLDALHLAFDWGPRTLDTLRLWAIAAPVAGFVLLALAVLGLLLLGRSSRAHQGLASALLIAAAGVPLGAMTQVRDLDIEADTSPGQAYAPMVVDTWTARGGKGSHTYHVRLDGWPGMPDGYEMTVRYGDFARYRIGDNVEVVQHPGRFGIRWIEAVQPRRR